MNLEKELRQYFNVIINTEEFVVVVDATGLYMFHLGNKDESLITTAEQVIEALSLDKKDCVLAFISDYSDHDYDSFTFETESMKDFVYVVDSLELEAFVRKFAGKRDFVFNEEIIDSIIDCFYDVPDFITDVEQQLLDIGIDRETAHKLYLRNPISTQEVFDLGCPDLLVDEAFQIMLEWYDTKTPKVELNDAAYQAIVDGVRSYSWMAAGCNALGLLCLLMGFLNVGALRYLYYFSVVFGYVASVFGSRARKMKSNVWGEINEVLGYAIIICVIAPLLAKGIVLAGRYLSSIEFDYSLEEYFNGLHF